MSAIRKMIETLYSEGVNYYKLEDCCFYPKERISASHIGVDNYISTENLLSNKAGKAKATSLPSDPCIAVKTNDILIGNIRPYLKKIWLADTDGGTNGDVVLLRVNERFSSFLLPRFLYYVLSSDAFFDYDNKFAKGAKMPRGDKKKILEYEIPVPPLEVQSKIVDILDNYTTHTAELTANLTAELDARKKQYDYYKETLLADAEEYEYVTLDSICNKIKNVKWAITEGTREYIDLSSVDRQNHSILQTTTIDKKTAPSRAQQVVLTNDVLFATTRPTLMKFCLVGERFDNQICSTGYCVLRPQESVCPKWLYYQISTKRFYDYVDANQAGAGYPSISDALVKSFTIPLPPISEQERIINILDKLEMLTANLSDDLSTEFKVRQQQYEFYRNQLLTFKRAN